MIFGIGKPGKGKHGDAVIFLNLLVVDDDAFKRAGPIGQAQLLEAGGKGMQDADHAAARFLHRERCVRSKHFEEDAFQNPATFRLLQLGEVKLRANDARREDQGIRELGLAVFEAAHYLQTYHTTCQSIVGHTRMIEIASEEDGKVERAVVFVFENLHRARSFQGTDHDLIIAWDEFVEDTLRQAESPVATPAPELLPIVERNRVIVTMIVMEVLAEFLETYSSGKAL